MFEPAKKSRAVLCDEAEEMLKNGTSFEEIRAYLKRQTSEEEIDIIMPIVNRNQLKQITKTSSSRKDRSKFYLGLFMTVLGIFLTTFLSLLYKIIDLGITIPLILTGILLMGVGLKGFENNSQ